MIRLIPEKKFFPFMVIVSFLFMVGGPVYSDLQVGSSISGKILSPDKITPVAGAIVKAAEMESKKVYESQATAENGFYEITGLPKGTYDIAVQAEKGLYAVNKLLNVGEIESHSVSLVLNENPENPKEEKGEKPEGTEAKKGKPGFWNNPLTATLAVVGIAVVLGFAIEEITEEEPISPH